jgi:7,8-dihydropterin-6-yl-methyl-4-(beta-D-ribofuranosyl)aminobenzene 5'-phosphate synthase
MLIPLDTLDILAIVENETDPMSPAPPCVTVTGRLGEVALGKGRLVGDVRGGGIVKEVAMEQLCCGAHGLSLMIVSLLRPFLYIRT